MSRCGTWTVVRHPLPSLVPPTRMAGRPCPDAQLHRTTASFCLVHTYCEITRKKKKIENEEIIFTTKACTGRRADFERSLDSTGQKGLGETYRTGISQPHHRDMSFQRERAIVLVFLL